MKSDTSESGSVIKDVVAVFLLLIVLVVIGIIGLLFLGPGA